MAFFCGFFPARRSNTSPSHRSSSQAPAQAPARPRAPLGGRRPGARAQTGWRTSRTHRWWCSGSWGAHRLPGSDDDEAAVPVMYSARRMFAASEWLREELQERDDLGRGPPVPRSGSCRTSFPSAWADDAGLTGTPAPASPSSAAWAARRPPDF